MDSGAHKRKRARLARQYRVRQGVKGTAERPRLSVSRSNRHIYAQLIDDVQGISLGGFGTLSKGNAEEHRVKSKEAARKIGTQIAQIAQQRNISTVIFDRGYYKYHGLIAELADAARAGGLQF